MPRMLLFSDVHCDLAAVSRLVEQSHDVDIAVGAGDFANMGSGLQSTINALSDLACPTILVPGNGERFDALNAATSDWPAAQVLHGTGACVAGVNFFGIGGGIPQTPFGELSYDFSEAEAQHLLADCAKWLCADVESSSTNEPSVFVTHSPALGLLDVSSKGASIGSQSILAAIDRCKPRLVVCGHVHACGGQTIDHGPTKIVNAGPHGIVIDLS